MNFKTLLLGTAAALSVVGGAQAADLAVAEPVDYVKVCDAYGVGYWYIPGTDTCIRIGGYVKLNAYVFNQRSAPQLRRPRRFGLRQPEHGLDQHGVPVLRRLLGALAVQH